MESAFPCFVTYGKDRWSAGLSIRWRDAAPEKRGHTIKIKSVSGYTSGEKLIHLRVVAGKNNAAGRDIANDVFENSILLTNRVHVRQVKFQRRWIAWGIRVLNEGNSQAACVSGRKRIEKQIIENAEDYRRGTDAESQRKNRAKCNSPVLAQIPDAILKIAQQAAHGTTSSVCLESTPPAWKQEAHVCFCLRIDQPCAAETLPGWFRYQLSFCDRVFNNPALPFCIAAIHRGSIAINETISPGSLRKSDPKLRPSLPTSKAPRLIAYQLNKEDIPLTISDTMAAAFKCGVPRNQCTKNSKT